MYPMYGHMDSYPHQRSYAPYNQNLDPVAYQMKPDLSKSPSPYEYHPYGFNNYYHPHPMEFHNCCNHNFFPNCYTFRPPYPHFPPPPPPQPFHYHGNYAPHPHYPMELQPRYDYDKNTPRDHHCCGCTHHSCISKENQIVKMEEPDPYSKKKTSDSSRNYPYPVAWIPPGCLKKEDEKRKSVEVHSKGKEGTENSKSFDEGIRLLNEWLPLDMNKLESLMQDGDEKKVQEQKNDEDRRFPFSIVRVPSNPNELETNGPKENKLPSNFSITPMEAVETEDSDSVQNIPKKMEKRNDKGTEEKSRNIHVEFRTDGGERKITKNSEKGVSSSSSPRKSSKLPHVCLRVDPLPGKKRSSRSPSPTNKGKSENSTSENPKIQVSPNVKENSQETKHSAKLVEPVEKSKENELKNGKCGSEESIEGKNVIFGQSGEEKCEVGEGKVESEKKENEGVKKILCEEEAAVIIQSVYRGYEVRKWESLIKLKHIAKVKDQTAEIKRNIEALESSSTDDRQRLVIGETIMSLLLKLDTIQGLHPSIRDIRKSVARELVSLQEKLDALIPKKPIEDHPTTTTAAPTTTNEAAKNIDPPLLHKEANVGNGGPPEAVEDINGKSENVLEDEDMQAEKENDEIVLKKAQVEEVNIGNEPAVVEDLNGKAEDSPVIEDEVVLPLEKEEPKLEIPVVGEENDEKALEEIKAESDVQLEEAQQKEINREVKESSVLEDEATKGDEVVKIEEPKFEIPIIGEGSDEKVLEETKAESCVEEGQQKGINGKVDDSSVLVDEEMKADEVALPLIAEEPKFEIPFMGEENDEKVLEETKAEADVQLEEAQQKEFDHIENEISGKTEEVEVQANDAEELMDNQVKKEANDEYLGPKDDILIEEKNEVVADNIIEHPNSHDEVFVRQEIVEKLREEKEKLKEMVEKLVEAGKEQVSAISNLSGKVKDLERKLSKKKKLKMRKCARKSRTFDEHMVLNE